MGDIAQVVSDYIVSEFMGDRREVLLADDARLIEEGIIDSLGIFVLVSFLEKEFGVRVEPVDVVLENFETVNAITNLVVAKRSSDRSA